jgi:hypothetical protein
MLPTALKGRLVDHFKCVKARHEADVTAGRGSVALPGALRAKYPNAPREWAWQWVFPATRFYIDPETGERRRHHLHESVLQRAVKEAARAAGIARPATCHSLRSVSAWYPPVRDASFQRQFVLSPDRAWEFAAVVDGLDASLHCRPL